MFKFTENRHEGSFSCCCHCCLSHDICPSYWGSQTGLWESKYQMIIYIQGCLFVLQVKA